MAVKIPDKSKINRILIIKLRGIGDVVLSTVILDNLRKEFPGAIIDYLTEKPSVTAISGLEQVNKVLLFKGKSISEKLRTLKEIRENKYDLILDFYSNPTTALFTFLSGAEYRIGFPYNGRKYAYNLFGPAERNLYHAADLHLKTLELNHISSGTNNLYFHLSQEDKTFADKYVKTSNLSDTSLVGLCPTGGWNSKKCDAEKFAEIGNKLHEVYGVTILLLWGPGDEKEVEEIKTLFHAPLVISPRTTINEMAALFGKCKFLVANDSGPMHIATAVDTPVLALHGPTDPKLQGPYGSRHEYFNLENLECIICNLLECPREHECFRQMPIDSLMSKIDSLIKKNNINL